ncbi:nitroreductase family protein [Phenylobacterium sp.]|jgi:nitroreductase|uniref:nitroreductase family protein n=1 Tax=Phenylobacterium sp. TaxID=1871053 RepID=UPI0037CB727A
MPTSANGRTAEYDIDPLFLERWSPRAFTGEAMPGEELMTLFDAARWAPSAFNGQPWRFVYAHRETGAWAGLFDLLIPFNQMWAKNAAVLVFLVSDRFRRVEGQPPAPVYSHSLDAGAAWGGLALQASRSGWATHGMVGFDIPRSYEVLGVDEAEFRVEAAIAIGRRGDVSLLDEPFRAREVPSLRNPVSSIAFEGRFKL